MKDTAITRNIFRKQLNDSAICGFYQEIIKSIIKKKRKKHDQIVSLAKTKLNTIKVLISKALIH